MREGIGVALTAASLLAWTYGQDIERWRHEREAKLKADGGWLTLAGLFWLKEGENAVGSDPSNAIRLPRGPARIGMFQFHSGKTSFRPASGVNIPAYPALKADSDARSDQVQFGEFSMLVIHRGDRYAIRLKRQPKRVPEKLHWPALVLRSR